MNRNTSRLRSMVLTLKGPMSTIRNIIKSPIVTSKSRAIFCPLIVFLDFKARCQKVNKIWTLLDVEILDSKFNQKVEYRLSEIIRELFIRCLISKSLYNYEIIKWFLKEYLLELRRGVSDLSKQILLLRNTPQLVIKHKKKCKNCWTSWTADISEQYKPESFNLTSKTEYNGKPFT